MTWLDGAQSLSSSLVSLAMIAPWETCVFVHHAAEPWKVLQRADDVKLRSASQYQPATLAMRYGRC